MSINREIAEGPAEGEQRRMDLDDWQLGES